MLRPRAQMEFVKGTVAGWSRAAVGPRPPSPKSIRLGLWQGTGNRRAAGRDTLSDAVEKDGCADSSEECRQLVRRRGAYGNVQS